MGLEDFVGFDSGEAGASPEAVEAFKEQMKKNAAFIAAVKKDEKKQKDKEEKLVKILVKFIKGNSSKDLLLLISQLLEENIPAAFILSIIYLGNPEIQEEINLLALEAGKVETQEKKISEKDLQKDDALVPFGIKDKTIPLKVKVEIDAWVKNIWDTAKTYSGKLLATAIYDNQYIKPVVVELSAFVLRDFLTDSGVKNDYKKLKEFSMFFLSGIIKNIQEKHANKQIGQ